MLSLIVVPALTAVALTQAPVTATQSARIRDAVESADSVRIVRSARSAQASFESFRRLRLPRRSGAHGPCDFTIGRYCYWRGDDEDDLPPPAEAREIQQRRDQLLVQLDSAIRVLPGDAWLHGQRTRYLAEIPDSTRPRMPATECRADASWCHALDGYLAHVSGSYAAANSAFERALAAMDDPTRCRWLDISSIIDGDLAKRYESLDCPARERMARRLFALGAPFYMIATTDLFTEHMARLTRARMAEGSATTYGDTWADDARELVVRYGWPTWYSQRDQLPSIGSEGRPSITGHDPGRPYFMIPSLGTVEHPGATTADDWRLEDRSAPSGYAPAAARSIHSLPHQVARFRHGDSTFIVASWDASRDTSIGRASEAAVAVTNDEAVATVLLIPAASRAGRTGSATVAIRSDSGLVSIEVLDREERRAARARVGYAPPSTGRVRLSDLLVYRPWTSDVPLSADSTLADHAVRGNEVRGRDAVAVYWETYGLPASSEPVQFTLSVEQTGVGWARRAFERLGLSDRTSGVRVEWTEVPVLQGDRAGRGVRVDLSRLRPGRYQLQLTAKGREGAGATAMRELIVR